MLFVEDCEHLKSTILNIYCTLTSAESRLGTSKMQLSPPPPPGC